MQFSKWFDKISGNIVQQIPDGHNLGVELVQLFGQIIVFALQGFRSIVDPVVRAVQQVVWLSWQWQIYHDRIYNGSRWVTLLSRLPNKISITPWRPFPLNQLVESPPPRECIVLTTLLRTGTTFLILSPASLTWSSSFCSCSFFGALSSS